MEKTNELSVYRSGGILLYPSDTLWALGCDARNEDAVQKIVAIKGREPGKSFIILLDNAAKIEQYVKDVPAVAYDLIEFAEHPLTLVFEGASRLAPSVLGENDSVAVRIVKTGYCHKLIHKLNGPLVSTSANPSGQPSPNSFEDIPESILNACDYVVESRQAGEMTGKASTIMKISASGQFSFIRR